MRIKIVMENAWWLLLSAEFPSLTVKLTGGDHGLVG